MTTRERATLKRLARRLRTDERFAQAVAHEPRTTLARYALTAAQKAAVASLALTVSGIILDAQVEGIWL